MDDLFIQLDEQGNPVEHPLLGENLRQFGVDTNTLPDKNFAPFVRVPNTFKKRIDQVYTNRYIRDGDVITEEWGVRDVTAEEYAENKERIDAYRKDVEEQRQRLHQLPGSAPDVID